MRVGCVSNNSTGRPQNKLTGLKRHVSAMKQAKSPNYNLLERKISNLDIDTKFVQIG